MEKVKYWFFKKMAGMLVGELSPLLAYPFQLFILISLDTIFEEGGLKAAKTAVEGWGENFKASLVSAVVKEARLLEISIRSDIDYRIEIEAAFITAAQLIGKLRNLLGEGEVQVVINDKEVDNLGIWLRPGDRVFITKQSVT